MKATVNSSKFCSSKFLTCSIRQISSDFSTVKVLRYTVILLWLQLYSYITILQGAYDEYLLLWKGYPKEDATWAMSFDISSEIIRYNYITIAS